ncbi:S9 family peptidase [Chitinophaga lutea]
MKKTMFLFACAGLLSVAQAQNSPVIDKGYLQRLPVARWVDGDHFTLVKRIATARMSLVNAATGKETEYNLPSRAASKLSIFVNQRGALVFRANGKDSIAIDAQNATFSPDSARIAFTRSNDLYILDAATRKEWRVTQDGSETVYNGRSSWVYNEEILGRGTNYRAFWWSPNSRDIAFMRFDDSRVPIHYLQDDQGVHAKQIPVRYPNPGDPNPSVRIGIARTGDQHITWAAYDPQADEYFGTPYWTPDGNALWAQRMNRRQDSLRIEAVDPASGRVSAITTETQKTWIDLDLEARITFVPARKMFILLSDRSGWMHLYAFGMDGKMLRPLTSGNWAVEEILHIDERRGVVYFTATRENSTRLDLYKVKLTGGAPQRLTFGDFNHRVQLSPTGDYFITTYNNFSTPGRMALVDNNGKVLRELADERGPNYAQYQAARYELFRIPAKDGFELPVRVKWPKQIVAGKKYPVMVSIYGGPGRKNVMDGYISGYYETDNGNDDLIMVTMDHRGSGHFGKAGKDWLYGDLGNWEIEDYSTVVRELEKRFPFIDASRVGITGFSYGGYLTCLALVKAPDVFTCGLAGGSVTDWRLYDTHYTERYMGLPDANPDGYKRSSVLTHVSQYKGMLRMAQGTLDDNVHMRNTIQLVNALQEAGKRFELMLYPGAGHGWFFLHAKQAHFLRENQAFIDKHLLNKP